MKTKRCININKILPYMNGYTLRRINTTWDDEDYCKSYSNYYIAKDEVVNNVFICAGTFSRTMILSLSNGKKVELWGNNINVHDKTLLRINETEYLSPELLVNGDLVELTPDLIKWLTKIFKFSEYQLEELSEEFFIDEEIEYPGVCTPVKMGSGWGYSSTPLVLRTSEIECVLNSIENEELRRKIECILTARVFKKH
jgi:hypothetical protein